MAVARGADGYNGVDVVDVKVPSAALVGSTATRLITITSDANATRIDALKLIANAGDPLLRFAA